MIAVSAAPTSNVFSGRRLAPGITFSHQNRIAGRACRRRRPRHIPASHRLSTASNRLSSSVANVLDMIARPPIMGGNDAPFLRNDLVVNLNRYVSRLSALDRHTTSTYQGLSHWVSTQPFKVPASYRTRKTLELGIDRARGLPSHNFGLEQILALSA
jgi:hypothetical protein